MSTKLALPPDVLTLSSGARLVHRGEYVHLGFNADGTPNNAKVYVGPHELTVLVSRDDRGDAFGYMLHMSLSLPRGYPDWDLVYAVTRAVFPPGVDTFMPIPREAAFLHGASEQQRRGKRRQVFHVFEMPASLPWPLEPPHV